MIAEQPKERGKREAERKGWGLATEGRKGSKKEGGIWRGFQRDHWLGYGFQGIKEGAWKGNKGLKGLN